MADILIRGMEMPKDRSWKAIHILSDRTYAILYWQGDYKILPCTAFFLPEGHGRLIDADALFETMRYHRDHAELNEVMLGLDEAVGVVKDAPTIVPEEGGEADA